MVLVFQIGAEGSSDAATEGASFNLCIEDSISAGTTATTLEASHDVTLTYSGRGGMYFSFVTNHVYMTQTLSLSLSLSLFLSLSSPITFSPADATDISGFDTVIIPLGKNLHGCNRVNVTDDDLLEPKEDMTFTISSISPAGGVISNPTIIIGTPSTHIVLLMMMMVSNVLDIHNTMISTSV